MSGMMTIVSSGTSADRHQVFLASIFDHLLHKFETAISVRTATASTTTTTAKNTTSGSTSGGNTTTTAGSSSHSTGEDGLSAIAMLAVLVDFEAALREAMVIQFATGLTAAGSKPIGKSGDLIISIIPT